MIIDGSWLMIYGSWWWIRFDFLRNLSLADAARRLVRGRNALSMNKHEHTGLGDRACVCVHGDATFCTSSCSHHTPSPWCMTGKADRSDIENIALYPCSRPKKNKPQLRVQAWCGLAICPRYSRQHRRGQSGNAPGLFSPFIMQESPSDTADLLAEVLFSAE